MKTKPPATPELNRMIVLAEANNTQSVGEFLDWLTSEAGYVICEWAGDAEDIEHDGLVVVSRTPNEWIEEWLGIDGQKCEQERQALLKWWREEQEARDA